MTEAERVPSRSRCGGQVVGLRSRRQRSTGLFVLDFLRPRVNLAIEVDGAIHEDEDQAARDAERITNADVLDNLPAVLETIRRVAHGREPAP